MMDNSIELQRIMARTVEDPETGCHEWQGSITKSTGYGKVLTLGKRRDAHRAVWLLAHGPIAPGMNVCHTCDNRRCVRLSHLWLGTQSENMQDAWKKGRVRGATEIFGEADPRHILTDVTVVEVYRLATETTLLSREIAEMYGISSQLVTKVRLKQRWRHILDRLDEPAPELAFDSRATLWSTPVGGFGGE